MQRTFVLNSPLGETLVFRKLSGQESISELYEWHIEAQSSSHSIDLSSLLGRAVSVQIETASTPRYLQGIVTLAYMMGSAEDEGYLYRLTVRPWLWLATKVIDHKIWQFKTAPQMIQETLQSFGYQVENRLVDSYRIWKYCVQYQESSFGFVSRLMEYEGIYYYFEHDKDTHKLILCDNSSVHKPFPGYDEIQFLSRKNIRASLGDYVHRWKPSLAINSGSVELRDFDFEQPHITLNSLKENPQGHVFDSLQQYHWPGGFTNDDVDGKRYAKIRLQAEQSENSAYHGQANSRGIVPGRLFKLKNFPQDSQNREYLVKTCIYHFQESHYHTGVLPVVHDIKFSVLPSDVPFRSRLTTTKPRIFGPQTAIVTGPKGDEIYCDQYGRVKVHFLWDRHGTSDENSSCWIRVSNPWASSNFGGIQVPRIDDEVIVEYLDGDPDYPIITGRVYNARKMPPWELPQNATQMGLVTRSSPGGNPATANALRFEDKIGQEEVWLHAEKDQRIEVEHDEDHWVGNDRSKIVDGNETVAVHKNRTESVGLNETIAIGLNRTKAVGINETVAIGVNQTTAVGVNQAVAIGMNKMLAVGINQSTQVGMSSMLNVGSMKVTNIGANYSLHVGSNWESKIGRTHSHTIGTKLEVNAGKVVSVNSGGAASYVASDKLSLQCGQSSITLESNGNITISGNIVSVHGATHVGVNGQIVDIN
ncbi:type VI secretion system Vgr family protein [Pseudomonas nicosulfuronedens]